MRKFINNIPMRNKRAQPDKRITITRDIVMVEYANGLDAIFHIDHPTAKSIISMICLR